MVLSRHASGLFIFVIFGVCATVIWAIVSTLTYRDAAARLDAAAQQFATQHTRLIDSELARYRLMTVVLGEYTDIEAALGGQSPHALQRMNEKLYFLSQQTGAPVIYMIDASGFVLGASNADTPETFVGRNYAYRPYFRDAIIHGAAEYYAVGDVSGRPGLFLSRRIGPADDPLGVVVVKYEFDALKRAWAADPGETLIVDPNGIVVAATDAAAELHPLSALPEDLRMRIQASGQFHNAALAPGQYQLQANGFVRGPERMALGHESISGTGLQLMHIMPSGPALRDARNQAAILALASVLGLGLFGGALYWRITRAARVAQNLRALEVAVAQRTNELRSEIAERRRGDARYRDAREELAQANRLAILGSVTAGLVHEVNQPVATIRTLAENARHHLVAGRMERVVSNLETTVDLTARIGRITQEMRQFARRGQGAPMAVPIDEVIDGTLLLTRDGLNRAGVHLTLPARDQPSVLAERVGLEQVLVNLVKNAQEAVEGRPDPQVAVRLHTEGRVMVLVVDDNGPGIDPALADRLFDPFVTGKAQGLGLGLGIARDIMRRLGGSLGVVPSILGGAAFEIRIPRA